MYEIAGISRQRQGDIQASETVGGIERSVNASANITEEMFFVHDNVKKRCLECLLDTAKISLRNNPKKFQNISDDYSMMSYEIGGEDFAEADFGILIDNSIGVENLEQKIEQLAHAALQNQTLSFSTIMKLYSGSSLSESMQIIKRDEAAIKQAQQQEQENAAKDAEAQRNMLMELDARKEQLERDKMALQDSMNLRDNEYKLKIAELGKESAEVPDNSHDENKLALEAKKHDDDISLRVAELMEKRRNNKEKEKIDMKKASQKPKPQNR